MSPITRYLFPKDDDILLDYLNEDGQSIEPTGWSSYIPNYNPRDIVVNVRRLLNDEMMEPMDPWYRGFKVISLFLMWSCGHFLWFRISLLWEDTYHYDMYYIRVYGRD